MLNKRQRARRAFDVEHRKLLDAYHTARGGEKLKALAKLKQYMLERLREARQ